VTIRRRLYLARCYVPAKEYAEALALVQHANIHLRGTRSALSEPSDPLTSGNPFYYSLTKGTADELETEQSMDGHQYKNDWFEYDGGSVDAEPPSSFRKSLFFDIALNHVQLDMDRLRERAGKQPATSAGPSVTDVPPSSDKRPAVKAKVEEEVRAATPEPGAAVPARGGLGSILGGWWGRR
jgi:signal recognition particle subunit SRP68